MKESGRRKLSPRQRAQILRKLLKLPISTWRYKFEPPTVRHLGPMAQDFAKAFRVGASDKRIALIDAVGVAYSAIQALHEQIAQQRTEVAKLREQVARLRKRGPL